jgi:hypothetical protein
MRRHAFQALATSLALVAWSASASVVVFETVEEMALRVPYIVRGTVNRKVVGWDDGKRRISTWTEVRVTDAIKGSTGSFIVVKQPGGEIDGIGQYVAGAATFQEGEDCVLFLEQEPGQTDAFVVSSLSAGKIALTTIEGQPTALRSTEGLLMVPRAQKNHVSPVVQQSPLGSPQQFIARLRHVLRASR